MKKLLFTFIVLSNPIFSGSHAERIQIINANKETLKVKIQSQPECMNESFPKYNLIIPGGYFYDLSIKKEDLDNENLFLVEGGTNPVMPSAICRNLNVNKNYKIVFKDDLLGSSCAVTEIGTW